MLIDFEALLKKIRSILGFSRNLLFNSANSKYPFDNFSLWLISLTLSPTHKHSTTAHHAPLSSAIFHHPLFKRFILRTATEIDSELSSIHAKMIGA